jgi:hypothetical protein
MEIAMNMRKFKPGQVCRINYCRMYLNVITLSDIMNATGDIIDAAAIDGKREKLIASSIWQRTYLQKPDKTCWALWQKVPRQVSYKTDQKQQIIQPLGPWIIPREDIRQDWIHWQDPPKQKTVPQD